MRRVVTIDVPLLTLQDISASFVCLSTLDTIVDKQCILVLEDVVGYLLSDAALANGELCSLWEQRLAAVQTISYSKSEVFNRYISHTPDLCQEVLSEDIRDAVSTEMCALHVHKDCKNAIFIVQSSRWNGTSDVIVTTKDHTNKSHHAVLVNENATLLSWLETRQPRLADERHYEQEYLDSHGRVVSSFKAGSNKTYAESLLARAYAEYDEEEEEPHYLYTYDSINGCFVEFRGDRNFVYHGRDLTMENAYSRVPSNVRNKYRK